MSCMFQVYLHIGSLMQLQHLFNWLYFLASKRFFYACAVGLFMVNSLSNLEYGQKMIQFKLIDNQINPTKRKIGVI